jgi:CMP-N-acetylneuraminic acid synthetase
VPPARILSFRNSGLFSMNSSQALNARTQDLTPGFFDAGKLYLAKTELWTSRDNMLSGSFSGFELDDIESIDVDTMNDWTTLLRLRGAD